jgi:hypothetical protein
LEAKGTVEKKYLGSDSSVVLGKYILETSKLQIALLAYLLALSGWEPKVGDKVLDRGGESDMWVPPASLISGPDRRVCLNLV